jgi:hypothetical protein
MGLSTQPVSIPRPSLMKALTAGFDATSSHLILVIFSIVLDSFLWLGPRLRLDLIIASAIEQFQSIPNFETPDALQQVLSITKDVNFFSILRTYPVGVPSLMASRLSTGTPAGTATGWEIPSASLAMALWLLLTFAGITAGTLFFTLVAQSAVYGKITWNSAFSQLPRASLQVLLLTITCFLLILAAFLPFSCLMAVLLTGTGIGQLGYLVLLILAGFLIWMLAPLIFSPHGIVLNQLNVLASILRGFYLTRLTLPSTSLFILTFLLLSEGLDVLWNIPDNTTWLLLLGIIGHAFVTTSLLAASFVYYHDADVWVGELIKGIKFSSA